MNIRDMGTKEKLIERWDNFSYRNPKKSKIISAIIIVVIFLLILVAIRILSGEPDENDLYEAGYQEGRFFGFLDAGDLAEYNDSVIFPHDESGEPIPIPVKYESAYIRGYKAGYAAGWAEAKALHGAR